MSLPGAGRRVLLVDDADEIRLLLQLLLEFDGYLVDEAADGPAGVAAARATPPDAVLLDVQLPGLAGPDVLRALRAAPETARVPVVFLTAEPPSGDDALLALGARGVLRKPFRAEEISGDLAALL